MNSESKGLKRAFLVEDEGLVRWTIRRVLEFCGYDVIDVETVAGALDRWDEGTVDLLVTDGRLPDGEGLSLVRMLRERHYTGAVVYLSAESDRLDPEQAGALNLTAVLSKPLDPMAFRAVIQSIPAGVEKVSREDRIGRYLLLAVPKVLTVPWVDELTGRMDERWLALDCRSGVVRESGVDERLESVAVKWTRAGGSLCVLAPVSEPWAGFEALEVVSDTGSLEWMGRRLVSGGERRGLMDVVVEPRTGKE